jgi:parallel beta-helix repeat protein
MNMRIAWRDTLKNLPFPQGLAVIVITLLAWDGPLQGQAGVEVVTPYDYGAVGDGIADDSTPLQTALNLGKHVALSHGRFRTTRTIQVPASGSLRGPGLLIPDFDLLPPEEPGSAAAIVAFSNTLLSGFAIQKPFADGSYATGIISDHVQNTAIRGVEISGYSARYGIHIIDSENIEITDCYIHDFMMDASADMIADSPAGIRITRTHGGVVSGNRLFNIEVGPNGLQSISPIRPSYGPQGYQSDHMTIVQCSGITIEGNVCRTSGEGIDMLLSRSCVLRGNIISDIWFQGFKMLGVSFSVANGNFFSDCYQGIGFAYHSVVDLESSGNSTNANVFRDIGSPGSFGIPGSNRVSFGGAHAIDIHDRDFTRYNNVTDNLAMDTQTIKTTESVVRNGGGDTNVVENNLFSTEIELD